MEPNLKQVVDEKYCKRCDICCRFPCKDAYLRPIFTRQEVACLKKQNTKTRFTTKGILSGKSVTLTKNKHGFHCPFFLLSKNLCGVYPDRPLDCRIYPFVLMFDKKDEKVLLGADTKCPYVRDNFNNGDFKKYMGYLKNFFQTQSFIGLIRDYPNLISRFQPDIVVFDELGPITNAICQHPYFALKNLTSLDKPTIQRYLLPQNIPLSSFSFANMIIWSGLFDFYWRIIDSNLCIFAFENGNFFLYLPPLGGPLSEKAVFESFRIMGALNKNKQASRIENAPRELLSFFNRLGFKTTLKESEYICELNSVANLKGDKLKSKRWGYNYFTKNYSYVYRPYHPQDKNACLRLYKKWRGMRKKKFADPYYTALLADAGSALKKALEESQALDLIGRVVEVNKKICGFTFGYELNNSTVCIAFETTDLSKKGLSQFIFSQLAKELSSTSLKSHKFVNIMSDCGLQNLKLSKLSWYPKETLGVYSVSG